jgi:N utilization substance protein B
LRRKTRQIVFQVLYMSDILDITPEEASRLFLMLFPSDLDMQFFKSTLEGLTSHIDDIDGIITESLKNWKFDRISLVDRSILRLGTYEIFFSHLTVPYAVVINEAVELAKKFGTDDSGAFVNGVLDAIRKKTIFGGGGKN